MQVLVAYYSTFAILLLFNIIFNYEKIVMRKYYWLGRSLWTMSRFVLKLDSMTDLFYRINNIYSLCRNDPQLSFLHFKGSLQSIITLSDNFIKYFNKVLLN